MSEKSVIIIGAGIAGLSAGCYAQMNGFRSQVFELHTLPGGLCTAWDRKGYIFDGCIHYLFGSAPGEPFNQVWQELGVTDRVTFINHDELLRVADSSGRQLIVYADPDRLQAHMLDLSPQDRPMIRALIDGIRQFDAFDLSLMQHKPRELMTATDWRMLGARMLPYVAPLARWGRVSAIELAQRFKDPFLQRAVAQMFSWPEIPVMAGFSLLAYMQRNNAGFPAGGSLAFAQQLEQRYLALGGQIHYNAQVEKILVDNGRVTGVRLYNDEIHAADYVISAADGRNTIFHMLDGEFTGRKIEKTYGRSLPVHSQVQVSLGVNRDLSAEPHWVIYLLDKPLLLAGREFQEIGVKQYGFDPSLAPDGKSSVVVMFRSDYDYWQRIYGRKLYDTEQLQVADIVLDFLEKRYPGIRADVEVKDVATPLSYERYTGNWLGATTGWLLTDDTMHLMINGLPKTLPDLEHFYMAGQWVEPGGSVPIVAMSGRNAVQLMCDDDERPFVSVIEPATAAA